MMRSAAVTLLAAATAASAQTSISFFYPSEGPSYEDYENIALSIVEVQDADHTVVAFSCLSSTTSASWPSSTSSSFDDDSDSYYNYGDECVFVGGALTATVGPDSFAYTTVASYNNYYGEYDYSVTLGCTSVEEAAVCTYQSDGADAWSDYCSYTADLDYYDDDVVTSCISDHASSTIPASTSALQPSEMTTIAMTVTAGAEKLSAGATATGTAARATSTSHTSKFTVTNLPVSGATTTIGGPAASANATASASASDATPAQQTDNAAGRLRAAGAMGVVGGVAAMLAL